jgi:hypothetical protein
MVAASLNQILGEQSVWAYPLITTLVRAREEQAKAFGLYGPYLECELLGDSSDPRNGRPPKIAQARKKLRGYSEYDKPGKNANPAMRQQSQVQ